MLFRARLIPGFISIWGLIAAALVLLTTVLGWFGSDLGETLGVYYRAAHALERVVPGRLADRERIQSICNHFRVCQSQY